MIVWEDPDENGEVVRYSLTEKEAISRQKECAVRYGKGYIYTSDKEALDDFITTQWAWREE